MLLSPKKPVTASIHYLKEQIRPFIIYNCNVSRFNYFHSCLGATVTFALEKIGGHLC